MKAKQTTIVRWVSGSCALLLLLAAGIIWFRWDPPPSSAPEVAQNAIPSNQRTIPVLEVALAKSSPITPLFGASLDHREGIAAIARVPDNLSAAEQRALLKGLDEGLPFFARLSRSGYHHVANDIMSLLLRQKQPLDGLAGEFARMAGEESRDPVTRDYAIQHLGHWLSDGRYASHDPAGLEIAVRQLLQAARSSSWSSAGTAVIALDRASRQLALSPQGKQAVEAFDRLLDELLGREDIAPLALVSVLQVAMRRARPVVLSAAREIAGREKAHPSLVASALHVLGTLGAQGDRSTVEPFINSQHLLLRSAGQSALRKLAAQ